MFSKRYSVIDVRDAKRPRAVNYLPAAAGLAVYDISKPETLRRIGFMPVEGGGIHRIWYTGGPWAYVSALLDGFTDYIFITLHRHDPAHPREPARTGFPA